MATTTAPLIWEGVNLYCGDHDPNASLHLVLDSLKLPSLEEMYQEHHAGGSPMQIELSTGIKKLEPSFKTKGAQPHIMSAFGLGVQTRRTFTGYQVYRDKRTGRWIENKAIMVGRLGKLEADEGKRGEIQGHDHAINELWRYEVYFDGVEKYFWSFDTNTWRVDGVDQWATPNAMLRIPGY